MATQPSLLLQQYRQLGKRLKPYLRWVILGATLLFLFHALRENWQEVTAIRVDRTGLSCLAIALGVTLLAHIWSGWVWSWILQEFDQPATGSWGVLVYLKTNIAKYLPGNVWHFYGRVTAAKTAGFSLGAAILSVLMEPLLMAAAALAIALVTNQQVNWQLQILSFIAVLMAVHPRVLNPLLTRLSKIKAKGQPLDQTQDPIQVKRYPLLPLLGEFGFLALRGSGFLLTLLALQPIEPGQIPAIISAFGLAWLLGLVVPGAPGGIGIFEATAIALLEQDLSTGVILSAVALYRLISVLAEAGGAGLAWLDERYSKTQMG